MSIKPNHALAYRKVPPFLQALRERAGLTQRELAAKLRRPQWWVARIETGSRRIDVAEFIEYCAGCGARPTAALEALARGR
jgi:transcriptional regulator with XRE-family HTH domain